MDETACAKGESGNPFLLMVCALCIATCGVLFPRLALALSLNAGVAAGNTQNAEVSVQEVSGGQYLFLPSEADARSLVLSTNDGALQVWSYPEHAYEDVANGAVVDFSALGMANPDGTLNGQKLWVKTGGVESSVTVMQSANIRSVFVRTKHDISYVHASSDHSVSDTGTLTVLAPDASEPVYDGEMDSIRGRGNTTWVGCDKKPYQIKLPKKQDLLGTGEKTKTWLLLANAADPTLLRNTLSLKLANYMGSVGTPSCEPCDLYYNGEYRGSYLLTEKVKVEKNGVDIDDLDDDNEEANQGADALSNSWNHRAWSTNARGSRFSYIDGLQDPSDVTGGYLVELDDKASESDELSMFYTRAHFFTLHTPEVATRDEAEYASDLLGAGLDAAMNGGVDPTTGRTVDDLFDRDTLLATGVSEDFFRETDYLMSSTYFYVPRGSGRIYTGPVWDCDRSFSLANVNRPSRFDIMFLSGNSSLFKAAADRYYNTLAPTVRAVLLGDENAQTSDGSLHSLAYYRNQIAASQSMDEAVWGLAPMQDDWVAYYRVNGKKWSGYVDDLTSYMTGRLAYLDKFFAQDDWRYVTWSGSDINSWVPYENGKVVTDGWVRDGLTYYFVKAGKLQTGWLWDNGAWYYLDPATGSMHTGWTNVAGSWYYMSPSGALQTGWVQVDGTWYYLSSSGAMATGWLDLGGTWYYLDASGALQTGWQWINGSWYHFDASGALQTGWLNLDGAWYYLYDSGAMATGWLNRNGAWYYLEPGSGSMASGWLNLGDTWYWLGASGAMQTGWVNLGGTWYYFGPDGAMATGWLRLGGARYYLADSGALATGWQQIGDSWYFFDDSGALVTSRWVGNYYVDASGAMVTNRRVGNYYVGPDGAWEPMAAEVSA